METPFYKWDGKPHRKRGCKPYPNTGMLSPACGIESNVVDKNTAFQMMA
jgi:hypothetical protein